jgi:Predicted membrane-associated, metal-dependent hydrolase
MFWHRLQSVNSPSIKYHPPAYVQLSLLLSSVCYYAASVFYLIYSFLFFLSSLLSSYIFFISPVLLFSFLVLALRYFLPLSLIILALFFSFLFCLTTPLKYTAHICWQSSSITASLWKACSSSDRAYSRNTVRNTFIWTRTTPQHCNHT